MAQEQILIFDLGGQYTRIIARKIRELGIRPLVIHPHAYEEIRRKTNPKGIILSGGGSSIYDADAPYISESIFERDIPVLGICLGMHWLARLYGGTVSPALQSREYGVHFFIRKDNSDPLFTGIPARSVMLMSHGDSVTVLPPNAEIIASTATCPIAAFRLTKSRIWGIQCHPETSESEHGKQLLKNFLDICETRCDWNAVDIIAGIQNEVLEAVGKNDKVCIAYSGGVDSTFLLSVLQPVLGLCLKPVTIDAGNLREGELTEIRTNAMIAGVAGLSVIDAKDEFFQALAGISDAEEKRLRFRETYARAVAEYMKGRGLAYLIQGTIATDRIESGKEGSAEIIKTHHNVGVESLEPLRHFFKDEVRQLAEAAGLDRSIIKRMPFPGPGFFVRIIGAPVTEHLLSIVRWADAEVRALVKLHEETDVISQLIVALIAVRTTGVKGDRRAYGYSIVVRGMETLDFMTGRGHEFVSPLRREIKQKLTQHPDIVRVWFDETDKPPATFELE